MAEWNLDLILQTVIDPLDVEIQDGPDGLLDNVLMNRYICVICNTGGIAHVFVIGQPVWEHGHRHSRMQGQVVEWPSAATIYRC